MINVSAMADPSKIEEEIRSIEEEIRTTEYNKATQHHIGKLKSKLAKLKDQLDKSKSKGGGRGYGVRKAGDATVVLVGYPSVGKSTLLNRLTRAKSEVANYDFTTLEIFPGVMNYKGAEIQILDIPGIIKGAHAGRGRGREVLSAARNSDLVLIMVDVNDPCLSLVLEELYASGIRVNRRPPRIKVEKTSSGGIELYSTVKLRYLDQGTVAAALREQGVVNANVVIREDVTLDDLIDTLMKNRHYVRGLVALNKVDQVPRAKAEAIATRIKREYDIDAIPVSAEKGQGVEELRQGIFDALEFITIYMKPQGGEADLEEPMVITRGSRIEDVCRRIHRSFLRRFRFARVWGQSAKHEGQRVGLDHVIKGGDVVSLVLEKE